MSILKMLIVAAVPLGYSAYKIMRRNEADLAKIKAINFTANQHRQMLQAQVDKFELYYPEYEGYLKLIETYAPNEAAQYKYQLPQLQDRQNRLVGCRR